MLKKLTAFALASCIIGGVIPLQGHAETPTHEIREVAKPIVDKKQQILDKNSLKTVHVKQNIIHIRTQDGKLVAVPSSSIINGSQSSSTNASSGGTLHTTMEAYPTTDKSGNLLVNYVASDRRIQNVQNALRTQGIHVPIQVTAHYHIQHGDTAAAITNATGLSMRQFAHDNNLYNIHHLQTGEYVELNMAIPIH